MTFWFWVLKWQEKYRGLAEGLTTLFMSTLLMVAVRLQLMGSKAPEFAPADNPSADCPSRLSRTLTFFYLPAFNLWLLIQPCVLSFDWSMEAIPLIQSLADPRNLTSVAFYATLAYLGWNAFFRPRESDQVDSDFLSSSPVALPGGINSNLISSALLGAADHPNGYVVHPAVVAESILAPSSSGSSGSLSSSSSLRSERTRWSSRSSSVDGSASHHHNSSKTCSQAADLTVIALAMLVLPFIPATNLFFYVGFVVAERVLYIPSMGYCLLVALGFHLIDQGLFRRRLIQFKNNNNNKSALFKWIFRSAFFILIIVYSARTVRRNQDWLTEETLYRSGISVNPPKAYGNLANILSSTGRKEEAEQAYKKALSYRNNMADVHYNL